MTSIYRLLFISLFLPFTLWANKSFTITPLPIAEGNQSYVLMTMYLPSSEGFSPNINIMKQHYTGTIKEYISLSNTQFKQLNLTIIEEVQTKNSVTWEYIGMMKGKALHWYSKATSVDGAVYLATATALETQYKDIKKQLKASVDSMLIQASY